MCGRQAGCGVCRPLEFDLTTIGFADQIEKNNRHRQGQVKPLPRGRLTEVLEHWLHEFLIPDWQRARQEEGRNKDHVAAEEVEEKVEEKFRAEIVEFNKFRRRAS